MLPKDQHYPIMDNMQIAVLTVKWNYREIPDKGDYNMITYDPLWKTMKEKNISQYRLVKAYGFSAGQLNRLKNNQYVSTHTIGVLCTILECSVEDIMEFRMDKSEGLYPIMENVPKQPEEDKAEESEPEESEPEESGAPC